MTAITKSTAIKIGISACLTGENVRYDGRHKKSNFCMDELAKHVEFQSFCPEVAIGLPVPRPPIRQVRIGDTIKVCRIDGSDNGSGDVGQQLTAYGQQVATEQATQLSGFIFCAKSPSCGLENIKIYNEAGIADPPGDHTFKGHTFKGYTSKGIGFFAKQIMAHNPLLPCEENSRLDDIDLRENFIMRVFTYKNWQLLREQPVTIYRLTQFHAQYKYLLMSHNYQSYKEIGHLLGSYEGDDFEALAERYISRLMTALKNPASRKNNSNTLMHLQGYFKKDLSKMEKQALTHAIDQYREGLLPLSAPLTLLKHHLKTYPNEYLAKQVYFNPYPNELNLGYELDPALGYQVGKKTE